MFRYVDSKPSRLFRPFVPFVIAMMTGCSQTAISGYAPDLALGEPAHETVESNQGVRDVPATIESSGVSHFQSLCLRPALFPADGKALALRLDWQTATDQALERAGLSRLRKTILKIPGGGARFTEEQEIVMRELGAPVEGGHDPTLLVGAFERRIAGEETRSTQCAAYFSGDFLKTCELVGRLAGKAPDRNQAYPERNARFIQWNILMDGKEAILNCSRTPQSGLLPYEGTTLSLFVDHTGTARKTALRTARTAPTGFAGSDR